MPKKPAENLVLELDDTKIPHDPCAITCRDRHYIVVQPKDYDKRKKTLKHGAKILAFTMKDKTPKGITQAVLEDAKTYQFKPA